MKETEEIKQLKQKDIPALRAKILVKQGGKCAICAKVPKTPCLDHHKKKIGGARTEPNDSV